MIGSASFFAIAIPAVLFAGVSKGGFGSGAAFASASILALVLSPQEALGLMLPLLIAIDFATLRPYWRAWDAGAARVLVLGAVPGICLGALVLSTAPEDVIRALIGLMCLVFVSWRLLSQSAQGGANNRPILRPVWGYLAGAVTGFTSFVSHAGGPPAAVYLLAQRLGKTQFQATTVVVFWAINLLKAALYAGLGVFTLELLLIDLALLPFALLGAWLGVHAHRAIPERAFFALTYVMLTATGLKLLYEAVS